MASVGCKRTKLNRRAVGEITSGRVPSQQCGSPLDWGLFAYPGLEQSSGLHLPNLFGGPFGRLIWGWLIRSGLRVDESVQRFF